tara:strand:- start:474 stop:860 length:387 start_codon:yes stop_codon:yes gene_type:complete
MATNRYPHAVGKFEFNRSLLVALLFSSFLLISCANDGVPEAWDDQIDESGKGLVVRNFVDACKESNSDMSEVKAKNYCECVIGRVQNSVTYEKFKELDEFIRKHRDALTPAMISENYSWLSEAGESCA